MFSNLHRGHSPFIEGKKHIDYKSLKSGKIIVQGNEVPTSPLSSYSKAKQIANILKEWMQKGEFLLGEPVQLLPSADSGYAFKLLKMRPIEG